MKTETKISEENIFYWSSNPSSDVVNKHIKVSLKVKCQEHKASCQRFLEFLKETFSEELDLEQEFDTIIHKKQTDLKNAIKKYDEAGI